MRARNMVSEALGSLIDFGLVVASEVETATRMVLGKIRGDTDPDGNEEPTTAQEMWGCPAVMFRPSDESADGAMEVIFIRRGNEMVGIAYRELRDAPISLEPGEVCVRAFGTQTTYMVLRPSGEVKIKGGPILLDASTFVRVEPGGFSATLYERARDAFNNHTHAVSGANTLVPDAVSIALMNTAGSSKLGIPT